MNQGSPSCANCTNSDYVTFKFRVNRFNIYFCKTCQNGFTYPMPKNISKYYHSNYWISPGIIGITKNFIFNLFHARRKNWLQKYLSSGDILEVGAGEGNFEKSLNKNYLVTGIELPGSKIKNRSILKVNFLKWKTNKKFDAVIFWESLEHVRTPKKYLEKSYALLKTNGLIFIEYPRFNCLESRLFGKHWFHLDPPRHLAHLTDKGLRTLLLQTHFKPVLAKSILAFEYTIWGYIESFLDIFGVKSTDYIKKRGVVFSLILLLPIVFLSFIAETIFLLINQSPIGFMLA